jgi:cob(I)alamin adenosyltransferase
VTIYTRSGDDGDTGLYGGARVSKSSLRVCCYGDSDELNSVLGWCATIESPLSDLLSREQHHIFNIGSHLATPADNANDNLPELPTNCIAVLENEIDKFDGQLKPLKNFILPGGCELSSRLHIARTVCRRVERNLVELASVENIDGEFIKYFNRLSDWLFVLARIANHQAGCDDVPWKQG